MKISTRDILNSSDDEILSMMDGEVNNQIANFVKEFNRREWMVRIAKECTFEQYYSHGLDKKMPEFGTGFVVDGKPVPYFHPNRSFHDEIIWLNENLFFDHEVSFDDKILNSAIVKFYGPSNTLKMIVEGTPWKFINFNEFKTNEDYAWKLMSNIEKAKIEGKQIWGTTELRTSLQTASRDYARKNPSLIDRKGSIDGLIGSMNEKKVMERPMRTSDMIHWINYLSDSWISFYKTKPNMQESFEFLTKIRGIGNYYGYHFSSNLARMPGIGAPNIIEAEFLKEFNELSKKICIEHGNIDENADYVVAGPGSSKTIMKLIPNMQFNLSTAQRVIVAIRNKQLKFFQIDVGSEEEKHLFESSETGRFTTFGCEISCCQFNVFCGCKNDSKIAMKRAKAPISMEIGKKIEEDFESCSLEKFFV